MKVKKNVKLNPLKEVITQNKLEANYSRLSNPRATFNEIVQNQRYVTTQNSPKQMKRTIDMSFRPNTSIYSNAV